MKNILKIQNFFYIKKKFPTKYKNLYKKFKIKKINVQKNKITKFIYFLFYLFLTTKRK